MKIEEKVMIQARRNRYDNNNNMKKNNNEKQNVGKWKEN